MADRSPQRRSSAFGPTIVLLGVTTVGALLAACAGDAPRAARSVVAVPSHASARVCAAGQLHARFVGGGFGTGNDFGEMVVWNPGPLPCRVEGRVSFAAYYADGARDPNATAEHASTSAASTLAARMSPPRDGQDQSRYLTAALTGPARDDPAQPDALCRPQDEGTPAVLVVTVGVLRVRAANLDRNANQVTAVHGCHGRVLLEELHGPRRS